MERLHTLIDKLYQQKNQGASPAHLLFTVQLLQQELASVQSTAEKLGSRKVAVVLPSNITLTVPETIFQAPPVVEAEQVQPAEEKEVYVLDYVEEEEVEPVLPEPVREIKEYSLRKPMVQESLFNEAKTVVKEEPLSAYAVQHLFRDTQEASVEAPTLSQYAPAAEVHERLAEKKESLNDRLKREQTELAQALKESPIKDLRKGIGINDRFVFVRELFRGDDAAYERSIKTINNFNIYSEAEYWMSRELKLKLGWNESNEAVQHFYGLVRRRFS